MYAANKILGGLVDVLPELYYLGTDTEITVTKPMTKKATRQYWGQYLG